MFDQVRLFSSCCPSPVLVGSMATKNRRQLSATVVRNLQPRAKRYLVWDDGARGLAVEVQPSGHKSWKFIYSHRSHARFYTIGRVDAMKPEEARIRANKLRVMVDDGRDPMAERKEQNNVDTFARVHQRYVDEEARAKNKSWKQADHLIHTYVMPQWQDRSIDKIDKKAVKELLGALESKSIYNQVKASISVVFSWAIKQEVVTLNPCLGIESKKTTSRSRILSDAELPLFWKAFDLGGPVEAAALRVLLLTGQRPGEVTAMRREHLKGGWWEMPGEQIESLGWPGTKNKKAHRVWLPQQVRELIGSASQGFVFAKTNGLDKTMREVCKQLQVERAVPHDLRRSHGTLITRLGFGRDAMNRIQNHREGGIADVYDQHEYAEENRKIMERVALKIMSLIEGREDDNVVALGRG